MDSLRTVVDNDQLAKLLGIRITEVKPGAAVVELEIRPEHLNGLGMAHGAAIFALADVAFAAACNSHDIPSVGINATMNYLKAAKTGLLRAKAVEVGTAEDKMTTCYIDVSDEQGQVIATFQGLAYRKSPTRKV